jgi:hypothetical protein
MSIYRAVGAAVFAVVTVMGLALLLSVIGQ